MNFNLIRNIGCSKSTLISLYNELGLSDKIETATEPFVNDSLRRRLLFRSQNQRFYVFSDTLSQN